MAAPSISPLQKTFLSFCNYGKGSGDTIYEMDNKAFAKLARDCGLITKQCTPTDIDLFFTKVKDKKERRITFREFEEALKLIAEKKGKTVDKIEAKIVDSEGPLSAATKTQYSRFHDDKTTYTGVHKRGGPSTYDGSKDIVALLDRSPADIRGRGGQFMQPVGSHKPAASFDAIHEVKLVDKSPGWKKLQNLTKAAGILNRVAQEGAVALEPDPPKAKGGPDAKPPEKPLELYDVFLRFACYGKGNGAFLDEIDGRNFQKLCRDCGLLSGSVTETDIDLIFQRTKFKSSRCIDYDQFLSALNQIAARGGLAMDKVSSMILQSHGPVTLATSAEYVPFHDDKSKYTGAFKYGDPEALKVAEETARSRGGLRSRDADSSLQNGTLPIPHLNNKEELQEVFAGFAAFGKGNSAEESLMDSKNLQKLALDCGLLDPLFVAADLDLIFTKVKPRKQRNIDFGTFLVALKLIADRKETTLEQLSKKIVRAGGPKR